MFVWQSRRSLGWHGFAFPLFLLEDVYMPTLEFAHLLVGFAPIGFFLLDAQRGFAENASVSHGGHGCICLAALIGAVSKAVKA